jgi:hypothetical protein
LNRPRTRQKPKHSGFSWVSGFSSFAPPIVLSGAVALIEYETRSVGGCDLKINQRAILQSKMQNKFLETTKTAITLMKIQAMK